MARLLVEYADGTFVVQEGTLDELPKYRVGQGHGRWRIRNIRRLPDRRRFVSNVSGATVAERVTSQ